jgi:hypothetical protein
VRDDWYWFALCGLGFAALASVMLIAGEWEVAPIGVYGAYLFGGKAIKEG